MVEDSELLRRYSRDHSQEAFAELVQRRVGVVYAAALRQLNGDAHRAREVAQDVFTDLARKAHVLLDRPVLTGWLYKSAQLAARHAARTDRRRQRREMEAHVMEINTPPHPDDTAWSRVRPILDDTLGDLDDRDRDAIALRFFEDRSFGEIGGRLQLTDNAARMRVERALAKLQRLLVRRGISSTTLALATALSAQATAGVPAGMALSISAAALSSAAVGTSATGLGSMMLFMSSIKTQVAATSALLAAGIVTVAVQTETNRELHGQLSRLENETVAVSQKLKERPGAAGPDTAAVGNSTAVAELVRLRAELAGEQSREAAARQAAQKRIHETAQAYRETTGRVVHRVEDLDVVPKAVRQSRPVYPDELRKAGATGEVLVAFIVDSDGEVADARVVRSTNPAFDESAVNAVREWKFTAGRKSGQAVNVEISAPIIFSVSKEAKPGARNWF